jgi:hypothetical protein
MSHGQPASTAKRRREREKERKGREEREIVLNRRGAWLILGIWDLRLKNIIQTTPNRID